VIGLESHAQPAPNLIPEEFFRRYAEKRGRPDVIVGGKANQSIDDLSRKVCLAPTALQRIGKGTDFRPYYTTNQPSQAICGYTYVAIYQFPAIISPTN